MVIKKPYAFLIKHFRLVHFIFSLVLLFVLLKSRFINNFFNNIADDGTITQNISSVSVGFLIYIALLIVIGFGILMYLLMKNKKKPKLFYLLLFLYYIILLVMFVISANIIHKIEIQSLVSLQSARLYRDISLIFTLPQYIILLITLIRAVGFDIKKFNFSKDLQELDIKEEDSEEFEFVLGLNFDNYKRSIRKYLRNFKYYVLENTLVFLLISVGIFIFLGVTIFIKIQSADKTYRESQTFTTNNFDIVVTSSYLTNVDYNGNVITKDKYYLVADLQIKNKYFKKMELDLDKFVLLVGDKSYYPVLYKNNYFIDLGIPYNKEKLDNEIHNYLLVYEFNKSEITNTYSLKINNGIIVNDKTGEVNEKFINLKLTPSILDTLSIEKAVLFGDVLDFNGSLIGNSALKFSKYIIQDNYLYNYEFCFNDKCDNLTGIVAADLVGSASTLLILDYEFTLDNKSIFTKNVSNQLDFFTYFFTVRYTLNGITKISAVKNKTPDNLQGKIILETFSGIKNATKLDFLVTIRNKRYVINVK